MNLSLFHVRENELRGAITRSELAGLDSLVGAYCSGASELLEGSALDDSARRDLLARVIATLEWAQIMTRTTRASRLDQFREAARMSCYLNSRLAETRCP